jgi:dihydrofolate synthase/folylpolyglutamate synthase
MTRYQTTIQDLQQTVYRRGINYDLTHVKSTLNTLNNPHLDLPPIIHVAGTNGKGSTIAFLEGILLENGYSVGKYTSPHIDSYRERIQINQKWISENDFFSYFNQLDSLDTSRINDPLTEFEKLTLMMFLYFRNKQPDYMLLETGLGGRLDATNVVTPIASIITAIGDDHGDILGSSLPQIASEKAGIIKPKIPVITCAQTPDVMDVIQATARSHRSPLIIAPPLNLPPQSSLQGSYQCINYGVAVETLNGLNILLNTPISGHKIRCWGRFTVIHNNNHQQTQTIVIDAAHNRPGIDALLDSLKSKFPEHRPHILCGFLKRKNISESIYPLSSAAEQLYYCPFSDEAHRWETVSALVPIAQKWCITDSLPKASLLVITGSIYFLSQVKEKLSFETCL